MSQSRRDRLREHGAEEDLHAAGRGLQARAIGPAVEAPARRGRGNCRLVLKVAQREAMLNQRDKVDTAFAVMLRRVSRLTIVGRH